MGNTSTQRSSPEWGALFAIAQSQMGYFTTHQAASAGYSSQLLHKYLANGRVSRVRRGIYRVVHFPSSEHDELVTPWLWTERVGVLSHDTALALYDLSDALPSRVHMTVPKDWNRRRLRIPSGLELHYADLDKTERASFSAMEITTPCRTLHDCIAAHLSPDLIRQGVLQARQRGLISREDEAELDNALAGVESTP